MMKRTHNKTAHAPAISRKFASFTKDFTLILTFCGNICNFSLKPWKLSVENVQFFKEFWTSISFRCETRICFWYKRFFQLEICDFDFCLKWFDKFWTTDNFWRSFVNLMCLYAVTTSICFGKIVFFFIATNGRFWIRKKCLKWISFGDLRNHCTLCKFWMTHSWMSKHA